MRTPVIAMVLAACGGADPALPTLGGTWRTGAEGLSAQVIRANVTKPEQAPILSSHWRFDDSTEPVRWCRRDVRTPDGADTPDPCDCTEAAFTDCAQGTLRLDDPLAPGVVADVVLVHDDARANLVGVMALFPGGNEDVLGLHVVSAQEPAARRPDATMGLQGSVWMGADTLTWYRRR